MADDKVQKARRKSLDQLVGGFAGMDAASMSKMKEGVQTNDRSAPVIDKDIALNK